MKLLAVLLWGVALLLLLGFSDSAGLRLLGVAVGLCAVGATLNVWQNR